MRRMGSRAARRRTSIPACAGWRSPTSAATCRVGAARTATGADPVRSRHGGGDGAVWHDGMLQPYRMPRRDGHHAAHGETGDLLARRSARDPQAPAQHPRRSDLRLRRDRRAAYRPCGPDGRHRSCRHRDRLRTLRVPAQSGQCFRRKAVTPLRVDRIRRRRSTGRAKGSPARSAGEGRCLPGASRCAALAWGFAPRPVASPSREGHSKPTIEVPVSS